jgi:NAD(P)-dependent dehydrogenase (short-subunit alcohol dehydrogenase family)
MSRVGCSVVAVDIDRAALDSLAAELREEGGEISTFVTDVSEESALTDLVDELDRSEIFVDVLINNVGVNTDFEETRKGSFPLWRKTFDANLIGPYHLTRMIVDRMIGRRHRGSVVFLSSIHQWHIRGHPAYAASKAGVGMVVKELASEFARYGIRVNGIAPGPVSPDSEVPSTRYAAVPLHGTAIPASYIGRCAVYLTSDFFSAYTTGTVITVDAGMLARGFLKPVEEG